MQYPTSHNVAWPVFLALLFVIGGCTSPNHYSLLATQVAEHYRTHVDYASLYWIEQHVFVERMSEDEVVRLLGEGVEPWIGDATLMRMYPSRRDEPEGHLLLVYYSSDRRVTNWEWVSE